VLTIAQACKFLGVTRSLFLTWIASGLKPSRGRRFSKRALLAWVKRQYAVAVTVA